MSLTSAEYDGYYARSVKAAIDAMAEVSKYDLLVVTSHGDHLSCRTGQSVYKLSFDRYCADIRRGHSDDSGACIVTRKLPGRPELDVLIVRSVGCAMSDADFKRLANTFANKLVALLRDVRL